MAIDLHAALVRQRINILVALCALAAKDRPASQVEMYRADAQELMKRFEDLEKAIGAVRPSQSLDLSSCESAIEAIVLLLEREQRLMPRREIITKVAEGGLWGGKPGTELRVQKSLAMHLKENTGTKMHGKIKEVDGLVGLFDWDPVHF
jgi:hypothetical protein